MTATAFVIASGIKVDQGAAPISTLKALTEFFNVGDGKVPAGEWRKEVTGLTAPERTDMAREIAAVTGWTIQGVTV